MSSSTTKPVQRRNANGVRSNAKAEPVKLLTGGNPQIAKGDGDAPVQAYIAAMPGWKSVVGKRLDALIACHLPNVQKAVPCNARPSGSPPSPAPVFVYRPCAGLGGQPPALRYLKRSVESQLWARERL